MGSQKITPWIGHFHSSWHHLVALTVKFKFSFVEGALLTSVYIYIWSDLNAGEFSFI